MVSVLRPYIGVVMVLGFWGLSRGADADKKIQADVRQLSEALAKNANGKEAKDLTAKLAANAKADAFELMVPFNLRTVKGGQLNAKNPGFGFGAKPPAAGPDGIEGVIKQIVKKGLNPAQLADLAQAACVIEAVARTLPGKNPTPNKAKLWNGYIKDFQKDADAFTKAVKGGNAGAIEKAADKLDGTCIQCHNDFK